MCTSCRQADKQTEHNESKAGLSLISKIIAKLDATLQNGHSDALFSFQIRISALNDSSSEDASQSNASFRRKSTKEAKVIRARICDFQQCGILTRVDLNEPVQPHFKLRISK